MHIAKPALDFLNKKADVLKIARPKPSDDLFKIGILDSFTVADLVSILEEESQLSIPDSDVNETNFGSIESIGRYLESRTL